ncbi:T9SS type A sorting domain-containing protein [Ulvibacter litoralis]|uniref:Por secretion system C-terminal sorting domain-containing protein n=1 Tax=Ulvibacter litoralis TaxID=227084 RepID=A0A1G7FVY0_9FLAO|nr:T9SS type A sorting domain-containing protein [Ulvibacter litoralis]GHC64043.1 T9SS C-terminal target domain-containing protein [Ulvibacter litoralis]SDE79905.1 Por secretion system C-terminal sorting domain-containing protein [Ulvibacter litoralis]
MKNLLLTTASLLFSLAAVAQLYVEPNGGTDSYIYVKDQVLFVTDDVSLVKNPTVNSEPSIYLREEAQLIQGSGTTENSGNGTISVYQDNPGSDSYDYTYWASPVGDETVSGTGNKAFGIRKYNDVVSERESTPAGFTSSVNGIASPSLTISNRWIYTYHDGWTYVGDGTGIPAGRGFSMKGVGLANVGQTYDFRGRPNNGDIVVPVSAGSVANSGTLSGNPYPSGLDLNKLFYESGNEEIENFWYWDEDRSVDSHFYVDNKGGYGTWIPGPEDPTGTLPGTYTQPMFYNYDNSGTAGASTGVSGALLDRRIAPIGQGFVIVGQNTLPGGSDGFITIKNSHRVYRKEGDLSVFHRTAGRASSTIDSNNTIGYNNGTSISTGTTTTTTTTTQGQEVLSAANTDTRMPHLRLNTYFNETHMRQLVLNFYDEATDGYDRGLDGLSPMDATSEAYFPIGGDTPNPYVIQTVPFEMEKQIPFAFNIATETRVVLTAIEEVRVNNEAYLYDSATDTYDQITGDRTASVLLPAGEYLDRFFIVFRDMRREATAQNEETATRMQQNVDFFQNNSAQQLEVSNPEGYNIAKANIFAMTGQLVYKATDLGNNSRFTFPTGNLSDGIYLVMLTTTDNLAVNYKITVKNN